MHYQERRNATNALSRAAAYCSPFSLFKIFDELDVLQDIALRVGQAEEQVVLELFQRDREVS